MNRRAHSKIFLQKKTELFLNAAADSHHHVRRRVVVDLRSERVIAHIARVTRRDIEVGAAGEID